MKYACGECSLDMKIQALEYPRYNSIIGQDLTPTPLINRLEELCYIIGSLIKLC